ncbi:hypothetical protein ACFL5O_10915, partial [Myxococcota bacterium]
MFLVRDDARGEDGSRAGIEPTTPTKLWTPGCSIPDGWPAPPAELPNCRTQCAVRANTAPTPTNNRGTASLVPGRPLGSC